MFTLSAHLAARPLETLVLVSSSLSLNHTAEPLSLQVVRPRAPLIKFPNRQDIAKPNGKYALDMTETMFVSILLLIFLYLCLSLPSLAQEALKSLAVSLSPNKPDLPSAPPPLPKPLSPFAALPGTPDTLASVQLLTSRYRRRPLAVDEMEYIQVREHLLGGGLGFIWQLDLLKARRSDKEGEQEILSNL